MSTAAEELGRNVRAQRDSTGVSLDVLYARITHVLPESMWGSTEMIRRLERGTLTKPNPVWLAALAQALGCTLDDLSAEAAAEYADFRALVERVAPAKTGAKGR